MKLAVLDAKTHNFARAWRAGFTGEGSVVSVLDGGTDWGHPDLIGTWQTRASSGWPNAFDPFGTLVLLVAPGNVDQGLTWYTRTEAKTALPQTARERRQGIARVVYAVRRGPSRNFAAPNATVTHEYSFLTKWTKSGTVRLGGHPDDHLLALFGERAAFIVTDPNTAGVYDTVYVDLDNDHSFVDEKPVTKASPVSYRDMNGDGLTDVSGGLLYYISTGTGSTGAVLPGGPGAFGLSVRDVPGGLLAWTGDFDPAIGGHGTLTASNVVGQGVINGLAPTFGDVPGGRPPGMVIGGAPKAKLAPMGDIYFSFDFSTQFAYFLTQLPSSAIDITSNSYGLSDSDNDGFDAMSQEADIWNDTFGVRTLMIGSSGNGAPGYGTTNAPSPVTAMSVGASTQFGGTGWDSIVNHSQIRDNDVIAWSDRGPGATGANAIDVVADGAYSAGDATLNTVLNGDIAWTTWGGTSRSTPVAAGAAALVYQAWRQANPGTATPPGFAIQAREVLKSSARDLGYDAWTQGTGSVDAYRAVQLARGRSGALVTPGEWRPGDYRGTAYDVFPHVLAAGGSDSQTFDLDGSGSYRVSDRQLVKVASQSLSLTTAPLARESTQNFNVPDYLIDISALVRSHPNADMIAISANYPYAEFDPDGDYSYDQRWRLLAYDWKDVNRDGNLWTDRDRDGAVDHVDRKTSSNIDGNLDVNWGRSEIDRGEYVRFSYNGPATNGLRIHVGDPAHRMTDGMFIGFSHAESSAAIPVTHFTIKVDFYDNQDWSWVSTPGGPVSGSFNAAINVPAGTPAGMYEGAIVVRGNGRTIAIPVSVTVAVEAPQDAAGNFTGSMTFGGASVAAAQANLPYNNGSVFGATDWNWRAESGDWRFFYFDVARQPAEGSLFLVNTTWSDSAPHTDIDTLILGPSVNHYQLNDDGPFGAPYILDTVGGSPNTNVGGGVWTFDTASGGAEDLVAAAAQEGLHAILGHQVNWNGTSFAVPFTTQVGSATVNPAAVSQTVTADSGSFDVTFRSGLDLDGLRAEAFGLSQPVTTTETAHQDDPNDPASASVKKPFTLNHAARVTVTTALTDDLDLFIVHDANGDGTFTAAEIIASSAGADGNESVTIIAPADGNYQAWVQGFSVAGTPTFPLTIDPIQGVDLVVSGVPAGAVPAGTAVTIHVTFSKPMTAGQDYFGELQLGPPTAPNALRVPITIHRQ
jgi:hypothetical protein